MKFLAVYLIASSAFLWAAGQPNPPVWDNYWYMGDGGFQNGVKVFSASDVGIQSILDQAYSHNGGDNPTFPTPQNHGQFSPLRYAFLFKPGVYSGLSVKVGYYTSVIGLGQAPSDTKISGVSCPQGGYIPSKGALEMFWRSAENFYADSSMMWAVSQSSPLRRVAIHGDLNLSQSGGYSSGGFMADCIIDWSTNSGTQQQWISRNCQMNWGSVQGWNMVFVGCNGFVPSTNALNGYSSSAAVTNIPASPIIAEKPYIVFRDDKYFLQVPEIEFNKVGATSDYNRTTEIDFENVYVASYLDTAESINLQIEAGNHIVLTPGIYNYLNGSIVVNRPDTVILGLGLPTLVANGGYPCMIVRDRIGGIRIGGILFDAGPDPTPTLLQWGTTSDLNTPPSFLYDCFTRVGGPLNPSVQQVTVDIMVQINSANVVCDNLWLWRADHWGDEQDVQFGMNPCNTAIQVNGDNVIAYGLASEHTLKDLTQWFGNNGKVFFYQSEYPYDVTQENYADQGYVGYRAQPRFAGGFYKHELYGGGVYCYFRDHPVNVATGISTPLPIPPGVKLTNCFTRYLNGFGGISHVVNDTGLGVSTFQTSYVSGYEASSDFYPRSVRRSGY